jgi:hypothetical protein
LAAWAREERPFGERAACRHDQAEGVLQEGDEVAAAAVAGGQHLHRRLAAAAEDHHQQGEARNAQLGCRLRRRLPVVVWPDLALVKGSGKLDLAEVAERERHGPGLRDVAAGPVVQTAQLLARLIPR